LVCAARIEGLETKMPLTQCQKSPA